MRLKNGIPLLGIASQPSRIKVNTGTMRPSDAGLDSRLYKHEAFVPNPNWKTPSAEEFKALLEPSLTAPLGNLFFSVIRPPSWLIRLKDELFIRKCLNQQTVDELVNGLCQLFSELKAPYHSQGVGRIPAGFITTTRDPVDGLHIGLHIDNWYSVPPKRGYEAPNRLSLNLGCSPRRFLMINLPLDKIEKILSDCGLAGYGENVTQMSKDFLALYPDYPVISVEVAPGEAYIAPTEAIIHDGSTAGSLTPDIFLTILGHFLPIDSTGRNLFGTRNDT